MSVPVIGERRELGRYRLSSGERVLYGQRVDGVVRIVDVPIDHSGRCMLVERGLTSQAELRALISDYLSEAERLDEVPADLESLYPSANTEASA